MIDDKKIEDAKEEIYEDEFWLNGEEIVFNNDEEEEMFYKEDIKEAIGLGAKWAINEFIKDLWHPANEVPEIGRVIIMENYYPDGRIMFISHMRKSTFHNPIDIGNTKKWFYIDDLFPKEGDEQ